MINYEKIEYKGKYYELTPTTVDSKGGIVELTENDGFGPGFLLGFICMLCIVIIFYGLSIVIG